MTGGAWLSSARVVRCWVKSRNERYPGETVALVGHTGSGKSSIINVLMRFYEFGEGQILIDDQDIRDFTMEELRKKVGLVLQDAFMFYGDIADNLPLALLLGLLVPVERFDESLPS